MKGRLGMMPTIDIQTEVELDYRSNEAYNGLRTNIQLCGEEIKVIMITSATPNEGKSSVSFNLAVSLAQSGKKVVFIDADLRKSVMIGRYKINHSIKGLSHLLSGISKLEDVLYDTNIKNLHTVFSGTVPPNPAELLTNHKFKLLIGLLRENYDYVIIDTPPLGNVIDSVIVAQQCDGVAFVVASNTVSYKFIQNTISQLKKAKCRILGVILNKVDMRDNSYYGKYYGKYYGNYGEYK